MFGYFNIYFIVNQVLVKYNFFLNLFERGDKFRFLMKMKIAGKENLMTRNFSSSVIKKFNGYEVIKHELAQEEKKIIPIGIVYELGYNESFPVPYFSTNKIYLAYRRYRGKMIRGKEKIEDLTVKDCYSVQKRQYILFSMTKKKRWKIYTKDVALTIKKCHIFM